MPLTWTSLTGDDSRLKAAHMQEVVTNIHATEVLLELDGVGVDAPYIFESGMDPFDREVRNPLSVDDFEDLRDAVDYMDNQNYCRTHNAAHYGSHRDYVHNVHYTTHCPAHKVGGYLNAVRTAHHVGHDTDYHGSFQGSYDYGYDGSLLSGYDSTYVVFHDGVENITNNGSRDSVF